MMPGEFVVFLAQIAVMVSVALVCGQLVRRLGQPAVLGELIGGILLGVTVLGRVWPGAYAALFPPAGAANIGREAIVKLGLLFFLFVAGLEANLAHSLRKEGGRVASISLFGIAVPFALGFGTVYFLPGMFGGMKTGSLLMPLFIGTALSISALPVIARILLDLDLMKEGVGRVVMAAALFDDVIGWLLFAIILTGTELHAGLAISPGMQACIALGFTILAVTVGRRITQAVFRRLRPHLPWPSGFMGISAALVLIVSTLFELLGLHAAFGAFLAGVTLAPALDDDDATRETIGQFVTNFFGAPVYFVSIGLAADFIADFDGLLVLVVLVIACAGKIGGVFLGARLAGVTSRESLAIGFGMNARGAMGIILASLALQAGIISNRIFVALILMSLVTSLLSGPVMRRLMRSLLPRSVRRE